MEERIFVSEEEGHTNKQSTNDLRKKEQETEGHVLQTEKPKIPFVTPPSLLKPLFVLPIGINIFYLFIEPTAETTIEQKRCEEALVGITYEKKYLLIIIY